MDDILALAHLTLEPVVVADGAASVRWVATSELADPSPFMEGGEILLTTGLVPRDDEGWRTLVTALRCAGVVALGFGVGLSHPAVPPALRAASEDLGLNLFVVPRPVPFIAVSRAVADLLWEDERDMDRQSLLHQRALTDAALTPDGVPELLATLAEIVSGGAVVATASGAVRAASVSPDSGAALTERAAPLVARLGSASIAGAATEISPEARLTVHPVGATDDSELFLIVESKLPPTAAQRTAITTTLALLTLEQARSVVERDASRGIRAGALALAVRGDLAAAGALLAGASQAASLPRGSGHVVRARGGARELARALSRVEAQEGALDHLLIAQSTAPSKDTGTGELLALVSSDERRLDLFLELLAPLQIGVGPDRPLSSVAFSDEGAQRALALTTPARPVVHWSELAARGVDSLLDPGSLAAYAATLLGPITARDDADDVIDGLHAFLTHNGQVGPAAQGLGIHRNTLHARLAKAEDALGRSLHDPGLRADLWIALKHQQGRTGEGTASR